MTLANFNSSNLLKLLLPTTALILALVIIKDPISLSSHAKGRAKSNLTLTYSLKVGYNSVSFPMNTRLTAKRICKKIPGTISVSRHSGKEFPEYNCDNPEISNFRIKRNTGYFIRVEEDVSKDVVGAKTPAEYSLSLGDNFIGIQDAESLGLRRARPVRDRCN